MLPLPAPAPEQPTAVLMSPAPLGWPKGKTGQSSTSLRSLQTASSSDYQPSEREASQQNATNTSIPVHSDIDYSNLVDLFDSFALNQDSQQGSGSGPHTPSHNVSKNNSPSPALSDLLISDSADDPVDWNVTETIGSLTFNEHRMPALDSANSKVSVSITSLSAKDNASLSLAYDHSSRTPLTSSADDDHRLNVSTANPHILLTRPSDGPAQNPQNLDLLLLRRRASAELIAVRPPAPQKVYIKASKSEPNRPVRIFACPVLGCGNTLAGELDLEEHLRSHRAVCQPYRCKWPGCGERFARQHDYERHEQLHTDPRLYLCDACRARFVNMEALDGHMRSESGIECLRRLESYLRCEGCKKNVTCAYTHVRDRLSFTGPRSKATLFTKYDPSRRRSSKKKTLHDGVDICDEYKAHCSSPGSFATFAQAWNKMPLELSTCVLNYLEIPEDAIDGTAQLALVSKAWSQIFRPRLFNRLELDTSDDVLELEKILRSPISAWLSDHITGITFSWRSFTHPLSTTVLSMLPTCTFVHAFCDVDPAFLPDILSTAPLRHSLRAVATLHLSHQCFLSLRHILRALASMANLQDVRFHAVTWSGGTPLSTTEGANNICTGSFPHVRSVHMLSCTDNLVIPAWIFASTSTGHRFVRRTVEAPLPAETSAVINIVHELLGDMRINSARFRIVQRNADEYVFIGSLRTLAMSDPSYALRQTLAEVAMRSARDEALGAGDSIWSIREVALAEGLHDIESPAADYMGSRDWTGLASALLGLLQLERFHVLCGHARTKPSFARLQETIARATDPRLPVNVQYNDSRADSRLLVPSLFGISETDEGRYCVHESELPYGQKLVQI